LLSALLTGNAGLFVSAALPSARLLARTANDEEAMDGRVHTLPELVRAMALFGPALSAAGVAVAVLDPQGRLVRCNTAMTRLLGARGVADVVDDMLLTWLKQLDGSVRSVEYLCLVSASRSSGDARRSPPEPYRVVISSSPDGLFNDVQSDMGLESVASKALLARGPQPERRQAPGEPHFAHPHKLSKREWDIVRGLLAYQPLSEVSAVLGISIHTVRNHLKSIFRKMHVTSRHELLQVVSSGAADARRRPA
jgi:DNA-binding CsgD family transcriptional regulator